MNGLRFYAVDAFSLLIAFKFVNVTTSLPDYSLDVRPIVQLWYRKQFFPCPFMKMSKANDGNRNRGSKRWQTLTLPETNRTDLNCKGMVGRRSGFLLVLCFFQEVFSHVGRAG